MVEFISTGSNAITGFYVTYKRLDEITKIFSQSKFKDANHINIFIDLNSITKELFFGNQVLPNREYDIVASIINMIAHYRHYFRSRYKVESSFYLIGLSGFGKYFYDTYRPINEYNYKNETIRNQNPEMNSMVLSAWRICSNQIARCIPEVDIWAGGSINPYDEISVRVAYLYYKITDSTSAPTLIISKDPHMNLIFTELYDAFILRPRKKDCSDISTITTISNIIDQIATKTFAYNNPVWCKENFTPADIIRFYALNGLESRSIKPFFAKDKAMEKLKNTLGGNLVSNREFVDRIKDYHIIYTNYNVLDFPQIIQQFVLYQNLRPDAVSINLSDFHHSDPDELHRLCENELKHSPIMLDKL